MSDPFFHVPREGKGGLSLGPRPQTGAVDAWAAQAASEGVGFVISMLSDKEIAEFGLTNEGERLGRRGVSFTRYGVIDYGTPDMPRFRGLIDAMRVEMEAGSHVHIHCAGGTGRAGTVASCLLLGDGVDAAEAVRRVSEARGVQVPETSKQLDFVTAFSSAD